ncbi:MAG: response regulator [Elusimicrobia bacterium]|nr:response regulator [Elusimicrobiota bacterium]
MKGSILIVDDDANMRESINDNLEVAGYEVAQAASGAEAMAAVRKRFYEVILMDYNLGDATGIEVIKRIRTVNTESQILMLTAHASLDTAVKAIQESVTDFMTKPVDFDRLKHSIAKAMEKLRLETENRRLMADLKETNAQLERLNKMKSKFLSMSSHDLSNSLMTLQVSFEMLSQTISPSEDQKKRMVYISNGISQISRLIEDLVDWASIEQGKFRLETSFFAPGVLVEEGLVGPQGRAAARGLSLKSETEPGLPMVAGDKRRIMQVLNNLLENAIRHTSKGGEVTVLVSRDGDCVRFAIRDTGEGIVPENLDSIFESFNQAKSQAGGGRLGLGLSIAKEIIGSHKGRIWVESPGLGRGSTFYFTIPVPRTGA